MPNHRLLGRALAANGLFSAVTGGLLLVTPDRIGAILGVERPAVLRAIGIGLLAFGGLVVAHSARRGRRMPLVLAFTVADLLWVVGTVGLIAAAGRELSLAGLLIVAATAILVAGFAGAQLRGISLVYARVSGRGPSHRVCLEVPTAAAPQHVWQAVRDLGRIADYAPGLASSGLRDPSVTGVGAVRVCEALNGSRWAERCDALDDARRRVELEFLADEPRFPFPFTRLRGGWEVRERVGGSIVRVWWDVTPTHQALAAVILPVMEYRAAGDMVRTVAAMTAAADPKTRTAPQARSRRMRRAATAC